MMPLLCALPAMAQSTDNEPTGALPTAASSASSDTSTASADGAACDAEVEALRNRVRALEQAIDELEQDESGPAITEVPLDLETRINGWGAITLENYEGQPVGFRLDEMVLRYAANLDRRMQFSSEVAFEPAELGVNLDVETMELTIRAHEALRITAGRVHLPISYWAGTAFHGAYRFLPVSPPKVLALEDDGGGFMPMHLTGVELTGTMPVGFWTANYAVGTANGRSPYVGGIAQAGDWSWGKAVYGRFWIESPGGLLVGVGGYYDDVDPGDAPPDSDLALLPRFTETIGTVQLVYTGVIDFRTEHFVFMHDDAVNVGGYAILGVPVGSTTPYLGAEYVELDDTSPLIAIGGQESEEKGYLGIRYDLGLRIALKLQGDVIHQGGDVGGAGHVQLAAGF
ncbi:MAG: hypothetical protein D6798_15425 [Deltaproteobacteria bacterium]|nr:MAG: hypothetical protein D6798_15425 [Deltaproteobacteria bacterium]